MMGDAADDAYEAEMRRYEETELARQLGITCCPHCMGACVEPGTDGEDCHRCDGLGLLDKDGNPTEL